MSKHAQDPQEDGEATRRPNVRTGGRTLRAAVGLTAAVTLGVGLAVAPTPAAVTPKAEAHNGVLSAKEICVEGKPAAVFSGQTRNVPDGVTATLTITQILPSGATVQDLQPGNRLTGNTNFSFTLVAPEGSTSAQAVADLKWDTGAYDDPIGKVDFTLDCSPETEVTPAAPTASTPDCTNPNMTVTPGSQPGVVWNPSGTTTLTPGQSVTYTASPADGYAFPGGAQTSWPFTNSFNVEECITKVIPVAPTVNTASCEQPNIQATASDQLGVLWNEELPYLLAPGESVTLVASPAQGYAFPGDAQTSWTFTNDFKVEDCETPPSVGYAGTVSGDCTYGYGSASLDKNYDGRVKFTLWVGDDSKSFWVRPGDSGGAKLKGEPGDRVRLVAEGKNIAIGHMKKDCDTPTPECEKDCNPPPYECPTGEYWFDSNGNGTVEPRECKPAGPVDAGLGSSAPVSGGSSSGSGGGEQPNNGQRMLTGSVAVLERRPRVRVR